MEPIFEALSICASLHPDKDDGTEDDLDDDAFLSNDNFETFEGNEDQELSEVGRVRGASLNDSRYVPY